MKDNYYDQNLNAQKLYQVYQSKYCGVSQYLEAEISYVKNHLQGTEQILELGAGYGRIMKELAPFCRSIAVSYTHLEILVKIIVNRIWLNRSAKNLA